MYSNTSGNKDNSCVFVVYFILFLVGGGGGGVGRVHCKNGLVKLTNHWLPQFHLLFCLFVYREVRRSRKVLDYM